MDVSDIRITMATTASFPRGARLLSRSIIVALMRPSDDIEISARPNVDNIFIGIFRAPTRPRLPPRARVDMTLMRQPPRLEPVSPAEPLAQLIATRVPVSKAPTFPKWPPSAGSDLSTANVSRARVLLGAGCVVQLLRIRNTSPSHFALDIAQL